VEEDIQNYSPTVMFPGTPCSSILRVPGSHLNIIRCVLTLLNYIQGYNAMQGKLIAVACTLRTY